jgi:hypothetical protein
VARRIALEALIALESRLSFHDPFHGQPSTVVSPLRHQPARFPAACA